MKKTILGILLAIAFLGIKGQNVQKESQPFGEQVEILSQPIGSNEECPGTYLESMPEYKGGEKALTKYLKDSLICPKSARENKIKGRVIVRFLIDKKGQTTQINILRGLGYGCDEEVIRFVKKMPRWTPGRQAGRPVDVWYTLPIQFDLSK